MAGNVTNTLTANITSTEDSTQNVPINRGTGNPSFDSTVGEFTTYMKLANGDNVIALPTTRCYQLYIRNNDPALFIIVRLTPNGGILNINPSLGPGEVFCIWQNPTNVSASAGFTALTLTASGANALVEYFIGG